MVHCWGDITAHVANMCLQQLFKFQRSSCESMGSCKRPSGTDLRSAASACLAVRWNAKKWTFSWELGLRNMKPERGNGDPQCTEQREHGKCLDLGFRDVGWGQIISPRWKIFQEPSNDLRGVESLLSELQTEGFPGLQLRFNGLFFCLPSKCQLLNFLLLLWSVRVRDAWGRVASLVGHCPESRTGRWKITVRRTFTAGQTVEIVQVWSPHLYHISRSSKPRPAVTTLTPWVLGLFIVGICRTFGKDRIRFTAIGFGSQFFPWG